MLRREMHARGALRLEDLLYLGGGLAAFALMTLYAYACDRL
jgi:hypothetical protein